MVTGAHKKRYDAASERPGPAGHDDVSHLGIMP
jgi:hypothetical protein